MKKSIYRYLLPGLFVLGSVTIVASVQAMEKSDFAIESAKISMIEAIQLAEKTTQGKVLKAHFETEDDHPQYELEVVKSPQVWDMTIDATTGKILKQKLD